jgi:hypothetical protein
MLCSTVLADRLGSGEGRHLPTLALDKYALWTPLVDVAELYFLNLIMGVVTPGYLCHYISPPFPPSSRGSISLQLNATLNTVTRSKKVARALKYTRIQNLSNLQTSYKIRAPDKAPALMTSIGTWYPERRLGGEGDSNSPKGTRLFLNSSITSVGYWQLSQR